MIDQVFLEIDHVADGDHGEGKAIGLVGLGVDAAGAGGAHASAEGVGADDEVAVGVDGFFGSDHEVPPSGFFVVGVVFSGDVGVA